MLNRRMHLLALDIYIMVFTVRIDRVLMQDQWRKLQVQDSSTKEQYSASTVLCHRLSHHRSPSTGQMRVDDRSPLYTAVLCRACA